MNRLFVASTIVALACAGSGSPQARSGARAEPRVLPGITVLLRDSLDLVRGKRVGLVTNQTGLNEKGESDIDLLFNALKSQVPSPTSQVQTPTSHVPGLKSLFSPEHGIRGTEDRANIESGRDAKTGLPVHSLYTTQAVPPPDSLLRDLDVIVVDLFDIGTRTWTYVGTMLYTMRAAARRGIPVVVLDRPNPLAGRVEGPMLDATLANPDDPRAGKPGRAYALYPAPLRHGLTMGEMARWFNAELGVGAALHVIPAEGWRRSMWWDSTGLPWVKPSPNMPSLASALVYPALVAFEGSNVSVGRGTPTAFQRFGAPWMDATRVAALLEGRGMPGVRFVAESFTPDQPSDQKYAGRRIAGVRIDIVERERVQAARIGAAILWALNATHPDSLRVTAATFDLRFGSPAVREAIMKGGDPDEAIDGEVAKVAAWEAGVRKYFLYR